MLLSSSLLYNSAGRKDQEKQNNHPEENYPTYFDYPMALAV
jgi:hypothetical protein